MPPKFRKNKIRPPIKRTIKFTPEEPSSPDSPDPWNPPLGSRSTTGSIQVQPSTSTLGTFSYQGRAIARTQNRQPKTSPPVPQPPPLIDLEEDDEDDEEGEADVSISLEEIDSDYDSEIPIPEYPELGPGTGSSGTIYLSDSSSASNLYTSDSNSSQLYTDTAYDSSPVALSHHYPNNIHR